MLGSAETIGGFTSLFKPLDGKWKIFARQEVPMALQRQVDFPTGCAISDMDIEGGSAGVSWARSATRNNAGTGIGELMLRLVLERFGPTALLVNVNAEILFVCGRTGRYLESTSGPPSRNLLDTAREGLRIELSSALRTASSSGREVTRRNVSVKVNGGSETLHLHVFPLVRSKGVGRKHARHL